MIPKNSSDLNILVEIDSIIIFIETGLIHFGAKGMKERFVLSLNHRHTNA